VIDLGLRGIRALIIEKCETRRNRLTHVRGMTRVEAVIINDSCMIEYYRDDMIVSEFAICLESPYADTFANAVVPYRAAEDYAQWRQ
jgi:hypothetical protein